MQKHPMTPPGGNAIQPLNQTHSTIELDKTPMIGSKMKAQNSNMPTKRPDLQYVSQQNVNQQKGRLALPHWLGLIVLITGMLVPLVTTPARAELKLCNTTSSRVGVAIGYREKNRWVTEGWWNVASNTCEVLLKGKLIARYYYIHAVDYDRGGEWSGKDTMCTTDKAFTVYGVKDCVKRKYKRTGFFEIDTKNEHDWTVRLKYPDENGKK